MSGKSILWTEIGLQLCQQLHLLQYANGLVLPHTDTTSSRQLHGLHCFTCCVKQKDITSDSTSCKLLVAERIFWASTTTCLHYSPPNIPTYSCLPLTVFISKPQILWIPLDFKIQLWKCSPSCRVINCHNIGRQVQMNLFFCICLKRHGPTEIKSEAERSFNSEWRVVRYKSQRAS